MSKKIITPSTEVVIANLRKNADKVLKKSEALSITSQDDYDAAGLYIADIKAIAQAAEAAMAKITDPIKESIALSKSSLKEAEAFIKPFRDKVEEIQASMKQQMLAFLEKNEKLLQKKHETFKGKDLQKHLAKLDDMKVESNTSVLRKVKTLSIDDLAAVPREYLIPNEAKIFAALKEGKKVKGCSIVLKNSIAV